MEQRLLSGNATADMLHSNAAREMRLAQCDVSSNIESVLQSIAGETARQLLSRIRHQPLLAPFELDALDLPLRQCQQQHLGLHSGQNSNGLLAGDIIELHGPPGAGKTQLLYRIAMSRIISADFPYTTFTHRSGEGVLVVDPDLRFDVLRLYDMLVAHLTYCYSLNSTNINDDNTSIIAAMAESCLDHLQVSRPSTSRQFLATLCDTVYNCTEYSPSRLSPRYVMIDSLSIIMWPYKAIEYDVPQEYTDYLHCVLTHLNKLSQAGVTVLVSTWAVFPSNENSGFRNNNNRNNRENDHQSTNTVLEWSDYIGHAWVKMVRYRFVLSRVPIFRNDIDAQQHVDRQRSPHDHLTLCQMVYPIVTPCKPVYIDRDGVYDAEKR